MDESMWICARAKEREADVPALDKQIRAGGLSASAAMDTHGFGRVDEAVYPQGVGAM
jgi:hypothetical protein